MKITAAALVVAMGAGLGCGRPPARPTGLPTGAQWAGAPRKGCFLLVEGREGALWTLQVFDPKGRRHPVSRWRLQGFARTSLEAQEVEAFDGEAFLLNDGARLVPAP